MALTEAPGFWDDHEKAEKIMSSVRKLKNRIEPWKELLGELSDIEAMYELAEEKLSLQKFPVRDFNQIQNSSENLKGLKDKKNSGQTSKELSFNEKVDLFYSQNASRTSTEKLLEQAEKWYNSHKTRLENALEKL